MLNWSYCQLTFLFNGAVLKWLSMKWAPSSKSTKLSYPMWSAMDIPTRLDENHITQHRYSMSHNFSKINNEWTFSNWNVAYLLLTTTSIDRLPNPKIRTYYFQHPFQIQQPLSCLLKVLQNAWQLHSPIILNIDYIRSTSNNYI